MLEALRRGEFVDAGRVRRVSIVLVIVSLVGVGLIFAGSDGLRDGQGRPLGTDFANVWSAGRMALDGRAAAAFDPLTHFAEQRAIFGADTPLYGWHYPPFFLLAAAALALLPYTAGWLVWQGATFPLYLQAMRTIMPGRLALLAAAAFPAVFVNFGHGQNGFLTAALIGAALALLDRRPLVAGLLIGLLAYKPQFGVLIPLVLAATGRWRVFASAAATVGALVVVSTLVFGPEVWPAFVAGAGFTKSVVLENGDTGWEKIMSLFAAARAVGAPVGVAYALQGALAVAVAATVVRVWRSAAAHEAKAAALIAGSLLATPYCLDYDLTAMGPAIGFLAARGLREGFGPWERSGLALAFLAPLFARTVADLALVPLGLLSVAAVFGLAVARAAPETRPAAFAPAL